MPYPGSDPQIYAQSAALEAQRLEAQRQEQRRQDELAQQHKNALELLIQGDQLRQAEAQRGAEASAAGLNAILSGNPQLAQAAGRMAPQPPESAMYSEQGPTYKPLTPQEARGAGPVLDDIIKGEYALQRAEATKKAKEKELQGDIAAITQPLDALHQYYVGMGDEETAAGILTTKGIVTASGQPKVWGPQVGGLVRELTKRKAAYDNLQSKIASAQRIAQEANRVRMAMNDAVLNVRMRGQDITKDVAIQNDIRGQIQMLLQEKANLTNQLGILGQVPGRIKDTFDATVRSIDEQITQFQGLAGPSRERLGGPKGKTPLARTAPAETALVRYKGTIYEIPITDMSKLPPEAEVLGPTR